MEIQLFRLSDFGLIEAQFGTKFNANAGLDLNQLLFDGQVFVGLKGTKNNHRLSRRKT